MNASMQQKKVKNKGEEPEKINAWFTNQKTEEETKQQGNVRYSGTNGHRKKTKPTQQKCHMVKKKKQHSKPSGRKLNPKLEIIN